MARTVTTYPFGVAISIAGANLRFFLLCLLPYQNPVAFLGAWLAAITLMNNCYWLSRIPEYYRPLLGRKYYE